MKVFDYELAKNLGRTKEVLELFKVIQKKEITEDSFVILMKKMHQKAGVKSRCPAKLKKEYRNLKENFGFFRS